MTRDDPPPPEDAAKMARYVLHSSSRMDEPHANVLDSQNKSDPFLSRLDIRRIHLHSQGDCRLSVLKRLQRERRRQPEGGQRHPLLLPLKARNDSPGLAGNEEDRHKLRTSFDGAFTIQKNNQASMSVSLAQGEYCDANNLDPEDPRCAHVIFTGRVQVVRHIIIFHIVSIS